MLGFWRIRIFHPRSACSVLAVSAVHSVSFIYSTLPVLCAKNLIRPRGCRDSSLLQGRGCLEEAGLEFTASQELQLSKTVWCHPARLGSPCPLLELAWLAHFRMVLLAVVLSCGNKIIQVKPLWNPCFNPNVNFSRKTLERKERAANHLTVWQGCGYFFRLWFI